MDKNSEALILSREKDVVKHGNVLYGLVKHRREGKEILLESAAAMVNVLPRKRIYRMGGTEELETFRAELLKRPLVVQPIVQAGTGIQKINCFFSVEREKWTVMINQTHPKILGRILMGIDAAKRVMKRGEPFVLEFLFSDIIRRLYYTVVKGGTNSKYKYTDCEFGDLVVRYPGDFRHQGIKWEMKASRIRFTFDDIDSSEVRIRDIEEAQRESRDTRIIVLPRDELQAILPGWTFEDEIAEEKPYNYENYQICEEQTSAPISATRTATHEQKGRIRGRSNRNPTPSKYKVPVDLHAPSRDLSQETAFSTTHKENENISSYTGTNSSGLKFIHHYQGSGSGRSESSKADSGYEGENDSGGFENHRHGQRLIDTQNKNMYPGKSKAGYEFENPAYTRDIDVIPNGERKTLYRHDQSHHASSCNSEYPPTDGLPSYQASAQFRQFRTIDQMNAKMSNDEYIISDESAI